MRFFKISGNDSHFSDHLNFFGPHMSTYGPHMNSLKYFGNINRLAVFIYFVRIVKFLDSSLSNRGGGSQVFYRCSPCRRLCSKVTGLEL